MPDEPTRNVTRFLREWRDGDAAALDRLMPLLEDDAAVAQPVAVEARCK